MDSTDWHPARLIPTAGIRGQEEQEKRATSSLLAVMRAVPEFGHALLKELGAPKSPVIDQLGVRDPHRRGAPGNRCAALAHGSLRSAAAGPIHLVLQHRVVLRSRPRDSVVPWS